MSKTIHLDESSVVVNCVVVTNDWNLTWHSNTFLSLPAVFIKTNIWIQFRFLVFFKTMAEIENQDEIFEEEIFANDEHSNYDDQNEEYNQENI